MVMQQDHVNMILVQSHNRMPCYVSQQDPAILHQDNARSDLSKHHDFHVSNYNRFIQGLTPLLCHVMIM